VSFHKDITGDDLHIARAAQSVGSPVGVVTPTILGELYSDSASGQLWFSVGLTNADWVSVTGGAGASTEVAQTASIATASLADVIATGMTMTEGVEFTGAGVYLAHFSGSVEHSSSNDDIFTSIWVGNPTVQIQKTQRKWGNSSFLGANADAASFMSLGIVTVAAGESVEGRWRTTAPAATMYERTLTLAKVS
jgi:hypothetical protein